MSHGHLIASIMPHARTGQFQSRLSLKQVAVSQADRIINRRTTDVAWLGANTIAQATPGLIVVGQQAALRSTENGASYAFISKPPRADRRCGAGVHETGLLHVVKYACRSHFRC